ncbi:MAG: galactokinase [Opitutaceae bacterium]|jgi:galactokinase|nr:galactokinase [Opitutaceae bacterium]
MTSRLATQFAKVFGHPPVSAARAPGRIEFIGNHTDYNGGPVLGAAINRSVWAAAAPSPNGLLNFSSEGHPPVSVDPNAPAKLSGPASWANYPLGVWLQLPKFGLRQPAAFDLHVASDLPPGLGLSSSAAIELATALALAALSGASASRETFVKLARAAENEFVGMPCGILDQGCSGFGKKDHLVHIDCRLPAFSNIPLPAGVRLWMFNPHAKHALTDGFYAARHAECQQAAAALNVPFLANASPDQLEAAAYSLPEIPLKRARHVIGEIARVRQVCDALARGDLSETGRLLTASHRSSQHLFENSIPELDNLVDLLAAHPGVLGARLSGGGFGGSVMALTTAAFTLKQAEQIAFAHHQKFHVFPDFLPLQADAGAELLPL